MNPFTLEGRKILITGASSGIGRAAAILCSQLGAKLFITGRNESELDKTFDSLANKDSGHEKFCADLLRTGGGAFAITGFRA